VSFAEPAIGCQLSPLMLVSINVPLEPPNQQYWQAAIGYVELGMFQDANDQLEKIDPFNRVAPEVLAVRLAIYRGLKKWELMQQIAKRLKEFQPDNVQWTISLAYATRRAYSIDVARKFSLTQRRSSQERQQLHTILRVTIANLEKWKKPDAI